MRYKEFAIEALKPSQYRNLVKGWDKTKYAELFGGKYRIYIPLESAGPATKQVKVNPQVNQEVEKSGYKIDDYLKGIASKTENGRVRQIKIGKLLSPSTAQIFANDPGRQATKKNNKLVVISRHPYDIAGMSTDRGWTSCMNLDDGNNRKFVPLDIKAGTIIAYLINANDKNIENPQARMLIKPFVNLYGDHDIAMGIENKIYGTASLGFKKTVSEWVNKINASRKLDGIYELDYRLYNDTIDSEYDGNEDDREMPKIAFGDVDKHEAILRNPGKYAREHPDADLTTLKTLINYMPSTIEYMKNPPKEIQLMAFHRMPSLFKYVQDPSPEIQEKAVFADAYNIQYVDNPTPEMQLSAMKRRPIVYKWIKNPTPEVQKIQDQWDKIHNKPSSLSLLRKYHNRFNS
jgi:hypothetical protein